MHIALVTQWFPPESGWGGVGNYTYVMASAYVRMGHRVTVVSARPSADLPAVHERNGAEVHRLAMPGHRLGRVPVLRRYGRAVSLYRYAGLVDRQLRAIHKKHPIDIVEFPEVNAEGYVYAKRPVAPFIVRCHTPTFVLRRYYTRDEMAFDTELISRREKDAIRRANWRTAPSRDMARVIADDCDIPLDTISPIPNALDVQSFPTPTPAPPPGPVTVLHVGRMDRIKGVVTFTEAIIGVAKQRPDVRFVFIGDDRKTASGGSQRAELEAMLRAAGVEQSVQFLGHVDQQGLLDWYQRAAICAVPSMLYESFSFTSAQAMLSSRPVVATKIGGIPETIVDGETGILVDPGNVEQLAAAIVRLADDEELRRRMGADGRERVLTEFSSEKVARETIGVYERAIARFGTSAAGAPAAAGRGA